MRKEPKVAIDGEINYTPKPGFRLCCATFLQGTPLTWWNNANDVRAVHDLSIL